MSSAGQLLIRAVHQGDRHQCQALILECGADVNYQNAGGETPLHIGCELGGNCVELLLGYGADPNLQRTQATGGLTPLHVATKKKLYRVVQLLLLKGGDANIPDNRGRLPLHIAAETGDLQMARMLILSGNSVYNVTDKFGSTPRKIAENGNFTELATWLANPKELSEEEIPTVNANEATVKVVELTTLGTSSRLK
eukprot:GILI01029331.1.p1 GENE.GILI01029331.1~~GILI01029331.1.p1  ORF type:complete len:208 (+),score=33.22 GILI01029331.1:37-624(+)